MLLFIKIVIILGLSSFLCAAETISVVPDIDFHIKYYDQEGMSGVVKSSLPYKKNDIFKRPDSYYFVGSQGGKKIFLPVVEQPLEVLNTNNNLWDIGKAYLCFDSKSIYYIEAFGWGGDFGKNTLESFPEMTICSGVDSFVEDCILSENETTAYLLHGERIIPENIDTVIDDLEYIKYSILVYDVLNRKKTDTIFIGKFRETFGSISVKDNKIYITLDGKLLVVNLKDNNKIDIKDFKKDVFIEAVFDEKIVYSLDDYTLYCDGEVIIKEFKCVEYYNNKLLWVVDNKNVVYLIDKSLSPKKIGQLSVSNICASGIYDSNMLWVQENSKDNIKLHTIDIDGKLSICSIDLQYSIDNGFYLVRDKIGRN
ncbi:MAG: hypothetical protein GX660_06985 [Clostridiaceae bacterium]|nr:hypothetical protein [Clostridiaceae bacterium]